MTVFRECLEDICGALNGVVIATVMGLDGLAVDTLSGQAPVSSNDEPVEVDALLVEYSALLDQVRRSAQVFEAGGLEEVSIRSERLTTIIRLLTPEYFVAVALTPQASSGKARYLLRLHSAALVGELS